MQRKEEHHVRRYGRHHRMPTFGRHKNSVVGSPQHNLFMGFAHIHGLKRGCTMDSAQSPAGMPPVTAGVEEHLQRLYNEWKGPKTELSRKKFEEVIQEIQHDDINPSWLYFPKCESYTFEQFVQLWFEKYSAAKRPIDRNSKDLDKPISNYFISSSHNTYIEDGNQFSGAADTYQYEKVLKSGCRCVEIDVWDGEDAGDDDSPTIRNYARSPQRKDKDHWSFSSMFSWMKEKCHATRRMSFPRTLQYKQSEAFFKARSPRRARAISDMDPETNATLLKREPRVCHALHLPGGDVTLHKAIPFRTVCKTIRKYAFEGNDLPLIISLEVNANIAQQELMVKIMEHEFGDLLLKEALPSFDPHTRQPTLRELKGKIVIKTRTGIRTVTSAIANTISDSGSTLQDSEPSECGLSLSTKSKQTSSGGGSSRHVDVDKIADAVKKLAVYTYGPGRFDSFSTAKDGHHPAHVYSIGEASLLKKLHRTEHSRLFEHNKNYLARSFPEGLLSYDSSNPNPPTLFWRKGVQMVALNWERWDKAMELNSAMFDNESGWVLKPEGYRSSEKATCQASVVGKKRMNLTITVLAGQHIPILKADDTLGTARLNPSAVNDKKLRPRVTCFLHVESDAERDESKAIHGDEYSRKTRTARTDHPCWGSSGSKLHFPNVQHVVEELSFVRIHVEDRRRHWRTRTAWACIRLDRLQEGYRLINLKTDDGHKGDGMLLVKIEKKLVDEQPRPSSLSRKTYNVCKDEVVQLKSKWSCMG